MPPRGGLKRRNLSKRLEAGLLPEQSTLALQLALQASLARRPGVRAVNTLYTPANLVNGDTITIGADTYEVDIINTDSGVNTHTVTGALLGTGTVASVTLTAAPATALAAGDVIRIENELMLILRVISTTNVVVARAYAGSSIATHAANTDVFVSDSAPADNISVPLVTTLTPAIFGPAFEAVFNWTPPTGEDAPERTQTEGVSNLVAYDLGSKLYMLFVAQEPGVNVTATTEDFSNSTDNVWANATMVGGQDALVGGVEIAGRAVTSAEELAGDMHFAFPFTVRAVVIQMFVTATGQKVDFTGDVVIAYAETTTEVLPATIVTVRNTGPASTAYITPFASTHTINVIAFE